MTARLLVTGFGPFPTMPRNPSAALARAVSASPRWRLVGATVSALVIETAYAALAAELDPALAEKPDAVLMLGVAGRSARVRVERQATSRRSRLFPDVAGVTGAAAHPKVGRTRRSAVDPIRCLRLLRGRGVPAIASRDAGRYLCNAAYHQALALPRPVLFIHIPKPARPRRGRRSRSIRSAALGFRLVAALVDIGLVLLRESRRPPRLRQAGGSTAGETSADENHTSS